MKEDGVSTMDVRKEENNGLDKGQKNTRTDKSVNPGNNLNNGSSLLLVDLGPLWGHVGATETAQRSLSSLCDARMYHVCTA